MNRLARFALAMPVLVLLLGTPLATAQQSAEGSAQVLADARPKALNQVILSARSGDPFMRANAIEAIQPLPERARPMAQLGLRDPHPAVRFVSAVTVGKLKLHGIEGAVQDALRDKDPSVRAAAMYAATQLGMSVDISEMASFMGSRDVGVRSNAAMLLGLMGDKGALPMMRELGQLPMSRRVTQARQAVYRVQLAQAMVQLGDEQALEGIRAGAYSSYDEVRILAVQAMGRLQDQRMVPAIRRIQSQPPIQLQVAAVEALARLRGGPDLGIAMRAASYSSEEVLNDARTMGRRSVEAMDQAYITTLLQQGDARERVAAGIRASATFPLGLIDDRVASTKLVSMLDDPAEPVRLSAAAAILRGRHAGSVARQ